MRRTVTKAAGQPMAEQQGTKAAHETNYGGKEQDGKFHIRTAALRNQSVNSYRHSSC